MGTFYTDTDSVFLQHPLPQKLIGNELGQFKDELKGSIIYSILKDVIQRYS